jgi:hypothetical protein
MHDAGAVDNSTVRERLLFAYAFELGVVDSKPVDECCALVAAVGMHGEPRRLVDHDDVLILVDYNRLPCYIFGLIFHLVRPEGLEPPTFAV